MDVLVKETGMGVHFQGHDVHDWAKELDFEWRTISPINQRQQQGWWKEKWNINTAG